MHILKELSISSAPLSPLWQREWGLQHPYNSTHPLSSPLQATGIHPSSTLTAHHCH